MGHTLPLLAKWMIGTGSGVAEGSAKERLGCIQGSREWCMVGWGGNKSRRGKDGDGEQVGWEGGRKMWWKKNAPAGCGSCSLLCECEPSTQPERVEHLKSSQPFYNRIGVSPHVPIKDMVFYYPSMNYNKYQGGSKGAEDQEESHLEATHDGPEVWVLAAARQRLALTDVSDKVG
ncbi:hypothetical protein C8R44DRAFT_747376 [Mycena epipterygia]|nr:hypothetical protein C8R44DRAFT_747376 [Mycena epipterygia]